MNIKIKKLSEQAIMPERATEGSAAYDLYIPKDLRVEYGRQIIKLGFAMEVPLGYEAKIEPRSGYSSKGMEGTNSVTNRENISAIRRYLGQKMM